MKVTLPKNYKDLYTITEYEQMKALISCMKEYLDKPEDIAYTACREAIERRYISDSVYEIHSVKLSAAKNCYMPYEYFGEGTGFMDVQLVIVAETYNGFLKIYACLSDVWSIDGQTDVTMHWHVKYYQ